MITADPPISINIPNKVTQLPQTPGVYLMKDSHNTVIYVGKAKSLKDRVKSYFRTTQNVSTKTKVMVSKIFDIETILTRTEKEALILEINLIKKYRPRYNVLFRDDKYYPYLMLSANEPYPNLSIVRKPGRDGSLYFGPFSSANAVRETIKIINKLFPLRKCRHKNLKRDRPCIYFQLNQCPAPCCRNVSPKTYMRTVRDVQLFLKGSGSTVIEKLRGQMISESDNLNFELASQLRNQIFAIKKTLEKQVVVSLDFIDRDVFSFFRDGLLMGITALFIRSGRTIGSRSFFLKQLRLTDEEAISSFVSQYYHDGEFIPREIIVPIKLKDSALLEEWLKEKGGTRVQIITPIRGTKKELLKIAGTNAELMFKKNQSDDNAAENTLSELKAKLHLKNHPARIECFDISNIMGTSAVGSMVVFENGKPLKKDYRKFKIRTVQTPNDYAMMHEVLTRHLATAKRKSILPDLIVVDGGKGQLGVLLNVLQNQDITCVDVAALAKKSHDKNPKNIAALTDKIFLPNRKNPVVFSKRSPALFMLQKLRDEAHRFAIAYYRVLKKKGDFTSVMEHLPGIGKKTAAAVLKYFGSMERARKATVEELAGVPSVTKKRAEIICRSFRGT